MARENSLGSDGTHYVGGPGGNEAGRLHPDAEPAWPSHSGSALESPLKEDRGSGPCGQHLRLFLLPHPPQGAS